MDNGPETLPPDGQDGVDVGFAAVARLELDELLEQLVERVRDVQGSQGRLRGLLRANLDIAQGVDLELVLRQIVSAAKSLVDARYAALGGLAGAVDELDRIIRGVRTAVFAMEPRDPETDRRQ